ncbi:MAG: arginase family protein, partial [Bdellovibrionales bacterium]|nr:arginase family protein [Bdellovibrionales bacterium]
MSSFQPVSADLFFSRQDTNDPRLGELVQAYSGSLSIQKDHTYVLGYPDDEGIHLNGGRPGAKEGPDRIRQFLYRMTPPFGSPPPSLWEVGNLPSSSSLEQRHAAAQKQAELILSQGGRVLSFGGGHDYGYPDGAAFLEIALAAEKRRPLVINFDAHLDVRSTEKG